MKNPGKLIKERRKAKKLTLQNIADKLNVSKGTVSKWENNQIQNLKREKLITLASLLGISPIELIDGVEIEQTITINGFKTQLNYLLHQTIGLSETEKNLIKDYVQLICSKGKWHHVRQHEYQELKEEIEAELKELEIKKEKLSVTSEDKVIVIKKSIPILAKCIEKYPTLTPPNKNKLLKTILKTVYYTKQGKGSDFEIVPEFKIW